MRSYLAGLQPPLTPTQLHELAAVTVGDFRDLGMANLNDFYEDAQQTTHGGVVEVGLEVDLTRPVSLEARSTRVCLATLGGKKESAS